MAAVNSVAMITLLAVSDCSDVAAVVGNSLSAISVQAADKDGDVVRYPRAASTRYGFRACAL